MHGFSGRDDFLMKRKFIINNSSEHIKRKEKKKQIKNRKGFKGEKNLFYDTNNNDTISNTDIDVYL